ncbi:MAG: MFS transporter [Thermoflexales bacterium]|nr:MFS transporter [Thermoflexales bacterium]
MAQERDPSLKIDLSYATITLGSSTLWFIWSGWLAYFYLPPGGTPRVPTALYSIVMFIVSAISALVTPLVGYWSDQASSRWGRRIPFMLVSGLPMLLLFVLLWMPPVPGQSTWNFVYLLTVLGLHNIVYILNQVPYSALLPEIALTDQHRVQVSAWTSGFMLLGMILGSSAGPVIERLGYAPSAMIYASVLLPLFYLPLLVLRERPGRQVAPAQRLSFGQSLSLTFRNPAFQSLIVAGTIYWVVTSLVQAVMPFVVTEICLLSEAHTIYFYLPAILASLACYPAITWLTARFGKWRVVVASALASTLVLPGMALIGDWLPLPLMAQGIGWVTLEAIAMSGIMMLAPTFTAEVTDYDEELTGQRREGAYYAAWGLLDEVVNSAALALLPLLLLLGRSRTDPYGPLGVRMIAVLGSVLSLVAFFVFLRYPLRDRSKVRVPGADS